MTEDKEILDAVRILKEIQNPCGIKGNHETIASKNVSVLLALAERYLQVGEMLPRKSCTCNDPSCEGYVRNKAIEDCQLAYTKQMMDIISEEKAKWVGDKDNKFATGVRAGIEAIEYRLVDGNKTIDEITLCPNCNCMTKTVSTKCGKCGEGKDTK